ncbi:hypothetical protein BVRB_022250, partial [Beta vulgaris subsp. vulgaris]
MDCCCPPDCQSQAPGQSVMLGVSPGPLHAAARWAVWQHGGVLVPVFERSPRHQLSEQLQRTNAQLIIVDSRHRTLLELANDACIGSINIDDLQDAGAAEPLRQAEI